ncbi:MAG: crossover junction endodeoxyribonuclease RuvC [Bacteroides sp.]
MRILAVDQARRGGWSVFDYETKKPIVYGTYSFTQKDCEFSDFLVKIKDLICQIVESYEIDAVFIEDIQMQNNVDSFKKLAMLQGALISAFVEKEYLFDVIPPVRWQGFCNARGRKASEIKAKIIEPQTEGKKASKVLSMQFVREQFGIDTEDDNLADSLCIGWFVTNNVRIEKKGIQNEQKK